MDKGYSICRICGIDTLSACEVCFNCQQHKERHTEMKDRHCLSTEILESPDYIDCEEDD